MCPSRLGTRARRRARSGLADPERLLGRGAGPRGRRLRSPDPTPRKLLTSPQALRTPRPGLRREQADTPAPTRGSQVETAALKPESATPGAGPSADHALRPSPPPRGGGLWSGATNPSPKTGGSTNIRPIPPKEPTPRAVLAYGRPGLLRPSLPRLPRSRLTLVCFERTGSGEGVWYGSCA